jgi:hypothetical protein
VKDSRVEGDASCNRSNGGQLPSLVLVRYEYHTKRAQDLVNLLDIEVNAEESEDKSWHPAKTARKSYDKKRKSYDKN